MFCSQCGTQAEAGDQFCGSCGHKHISTAQAFPGGGQTIPSATKLAGGNPATPAIQLDSRTLMILTHLGGIFLGLIPSLLLWLLKKGQDDDLADQAKETLNFQLTVMIAVFVSSLLMVILIGGLLVFVVLIANLVLSIMAAVSVSRGQPYRYPFTWRLVK